MIPTGPNGEKSIICHLRKDYFNIYRVIRPERANRNRHLIHRHIEAWIRMIVMENQLMRQVESLRETIPNYSRFFIPMQNETRLIHNTPVPKKAASFSEYEDFF